jgi:hypothetical protein
MSTLYYAEFVAAFFFDNSLKFLILLPPSLGQINTQNLTLNELKHIKALHSSYMLRQSGFLALLIIVEALPLVRITETLNKISSKLHFFNITEILIYLAILAIITLEHGYNNFQHTENCNLVNYIP